MNLDALLDEGENIVGGMRKRLKYLMPSLHQSLTPKTHGPQDIQLPEPEVGNGELSEDPETQEKIVSDLSCQLDTHKSMGQHGMCPRVRRELPKTCQLFQSFNSNPG